MRFEAPWATSVKVITLLTTALLVLIVFFLRLPERPEGELSLLLDLALALPLVILFGSLLFVVRGYRLEPTQLQIERLLWTTPIDLAGLRGARHDPEALKRSLRLFGNGGLFVIAGLFYSKRLGRYRAFATDPKNAVVLDFGDRKLVVTPARPDEFVTALRDLDPSIEVS